jgi:hypothetical protein
MKKYGFTYAQWRAYSVPAEKAEPYRLCRDAGTSEGRTLNSCLSKAGVTPQQWHNRQASLAQGANVRDCMAEHGENITVHRRDGSTL